MNTGHVSYDELIKQVHSLKLENTNLRRELRDSSNQLTRLESDSSAMKELVVGLRPPNGDSRDASVDGSQLNVRVEKLSPPSATSNLSAVVHDNLRSNDESVVDGDGRQATSDVISSAGARSSADPGQPLQIRSPWPGLLDTRRTHPGDPGENLGRSRATGLSEKQSSDCTAFEVQPADLATPSTKLVTIATQTSDVDLPDSSLEVARELQYGDQNTVYALYHGSWPTPLEQAAVHSDAGGVGAGPATNHETASMLSFTSSTNAASSASFRLQQQQLGTKVEMVYSLLSMLGTHDKDDMSRTLLEMSKSQDSCVAMRQSGCLPLLIQLLHGSGSPESGNPRGPLGSRGCAEARVMAATALRNVVCSNPDSRRSRREEQVLRLLEQIRAHCDGLRRNGVGSGLSDEDGDQAGSSTAQHNISARLGSNSEAIGQAVNALMKLSFDEEYRTAICCLGGVQAVAELLYMDDAANGTDTSDGYSVVLRRHACMALTNLTYGDSTNKVLLCSMPAAVRAIVAQLDSPDEDLRQVAASVLRNLSWRADGMSKKALRDAATVTSLMQAAMSASKESTLKSILSALWNVSAHCTENKADVCSVPGALQFLVATLSYVGATQSLTVAENAGGVLRNISSYIAVNEQYRAVLRRVGALTILLQQLKSSSLTVVSNACGTLWNLSARCAEDQRTLRDLGAIAMLRSLVNSKHRMIAMGSTAALKNLLGSMRPSTGGTDASRIDCGENSRDGASVASSNSRRQGIYDDDLREGSPAVGKAANDFDIPFKRPLPNVNMNSHGAGYNVAVDSGRGVQQDGAQSRLPVSGHAFNARQSEGVDDRSKFAADSSAQLVSKMKVPPALNGVPTASAMFDSPVTYGIRSVDSSPVVIRRGPLGDGSFSAAPSYFDMNRYSQQTQYMPTNGYNSWGGVGGVNNRLAGSGSLTRSDDFSLAHISRRMENIQLANLNGDDQDEPINFSMKYVETVESSPGAHVSAPVRQNFVQQPVAGPTSSVNGKFLLPNQSGTVMMAGNLQNFPRSSVPQNSQSACRPNLNYGAVRMMQSGGFQRPQYRLVAPANDRMTARFSTPYVRSNHEPLEQPTNYSLRFSEQYEENDDGGHYSEQPIDYSTRYMEPQLGNRAPTGYPRRDGQPASNCQQVDPASFCDDTVKTFCNEGTPIDYLSTATSMTDLSGLKNDAAGLRQRALSSQTNETAADEMRNFSQTYSEREFDSQPTYDKREPRSESCVNKGRALNGVGNQWSSQPSGFSYSDNAPGTLSPMEQPKKFCTEGTPPNFSHASSLSSLQSSDVGRVGSNDTVIRGSLTGAASLKTDQKAAADDRQHIMEQRQRQSAAAVRNSINKVQTTDATAEKTVISPSAHRDLAHGGKTVTFDMDSNQVQETPLMFSRCSSLGSLSSFDVHSVHSSVVSEYSVRASQVVSPSELPDSPCDTMPPSPARRHAALGQPPAFFPDGVPNVPCSNGLSRLTGVTTTAVSATSEPVSSSVTIPADNTVHCLNSTTSESVHILSDLSSPVHYCDEGTMSSGTSLSALTLDDGEHVGVISKVSAQQSPIAEESMLEPDVTSDTANVTATTVIHRTNDAEADEDSLDDDDDDLVSEAEDKLLAECISLAIPKKSASQAKRIVRSSSDGGLLDQPNALASMRHADGASVETQLIGKKLSASSSLGSMQAQQSGTNAQVNTHGHPLPSFQVPSVVPILSSDISAHAGGYDSPRKFVTEDTPLNFSQSGSLSDLSTGECCDATAKELENHNGSIPSGTAMPAARNDSPKLSAFDDSDVSLSDDDAEGEDLLSKVIEAAMPKSRKPAGVGSDIRGRLGPGFAGPRRPVTRSQEPPVHRPSTSIDQTSRNQEVPSYGQSSSDSRRRSDISDLEKRRRASDQSSGSSRGVRQTLDARQGGVNVGSSVTGQKYFGGKMSYAPMSTGMSSRRMTDVSPAEDNLVAYMCEGTPPAFMSRDRSPPATSRVSHLIAENALAAKLAEDRSWNSSLSSLSFDSSLNAEPTAAESSLLQECINAAMPKSRGHHKTQRKAASSISDPVYSHQLLRTSPSGSSESSLKRATTQSKPASVDAPVKDLSNSVPRPVVGDSALGRLETDQPVRAAVTKSSAESVRSSVGKVFPPAEVRSPVSQKVNPNVEASPESGLLTRVDLTADEESLPSGPSTEANNTVIYRGPGLTERATASVDVDVSATSADLSQILSPAKDNCLSRNAEVVSEQEPVHCSKLGSEAQDASVLDCALQKTECSDALFDDEKLPESLEMARMFGDIVMSSTPVGPASKVGARVLKPADHSDASTDPKVVRGGRKSLTGKPVTPSVSPRMPPKAGGSPNVSSRAPHIKVQPVSGKALNDKPSPAGPLPKQPGSMAEANGARRRSSTPDRSSPVFQRGAAAKSGSQASLASQRSNPASPKVSQVARTNVKATNPGSPVASRQQRASPKPTSTTPRLEHKVMNLPEKSELAADKPRSPIVNKCNKDPHAVTSSLDERGQSNVQLVTDQSSNNPIQGAVDKSSKPTPSEIEFSEFFGHVDDQQVDLASPSRMRTELGAGSVGNLFSVKTSVKISPRSALGSRSGPTTPVSARKSLPGGGTVIAKQLEEKSSEAVAVKKSKTRLSNIWRRDKSTKTESSKTDSGTSTETKELKDKNRDGLGKSPKSFRKSFPLRKSKKPTGVAPGEDGSTDISGTTNIKEAIPRSRTYDKISDDKIKNRPSIDAPSQERIDLSTRSNVGEMHDSKSLDDLNTESCGQEKTKKLSILQRLGRGKEKSKDGKSNKDQPTGDAQPIKKKGFSLFKRDSSASSKKSSKEKSNSKDSDDHVWQRHNEGRELVKSSTLPLCVTAGIRDGKVTTSFTAEALHPLTWNQVNSVTDSSGHADESICPPLPRSHHQYSCSGSASDDVCSQTTEDDASVEGSGFVTTV